MNKLDLQLTLFSDSLQLKTIDNKRYIWCIIRQKWLVLQPEEMVRQLLLLYLLQEKQVSKNRIAVERGLSVNGLAKRCDILVFRPNMEPWLLVECKAPNVKLTQAVFRQIATYNMPLQVPLLLVSNGPEAYACAIDFQKEDYQFLPEIPAFPQ